MIIKMGKYTGEVPPNGVTRSGDGTTTYQVQLTQGQGIPFLQLFLDDPLKVHTSLGGRILRDRCSVTSGLFDSVTLSFSNEVTSVDSEQDLVKTTWDVNSAMYEKPLADHPGYRMFWDHGLWQWVPAGGEAPNSSPAWAIEATTQAEATGEVYLWSAAMPASKNEEGAWVCILPPDKSGITTWLCPSVIVVKREFFRSDSGMEKALRKRGVIEAPKKYSHLAADWLVTNCEPDRDGDYWVTVTEYTGADRWDRDLYKEAK